MSDKDQDHDHDHNHNQDRNQDQDQEKPLWVLGYGSLIFKPPPHTKYVVPGVIRGYCRRFWQSSSDHRGTIESKGRTVTLIPYGDIVKHPEFLESVKEYDLNATATDATTADSNNDFKDMFQEKDLKVYGCACYIPGEHAKKVSENLDAREQDGYTTHEIPFEIDLEAKDSLDSLDKELIQAVEELPKDEKTGKHILTSTVYIGTIENESFVGPESIKDTARIIATSQGPSGTNWEYLHLLYKSLLQFNEDDRYLEALVKEVKRLKTQGHRSID